MTSTSVSGTPSGRWRKKFCLRPGVVHDPEAQVEPELEAQETALIIYNIADFR
jgi:hypothetical protein